jgi:hypothetical protein
MADGGDGNVLPFRGVEIADPIENEIYAKPEPKEPPLVNPEAASILQDAFNLIEGDRHQQHGKAERCHDEIAKLWTWWTGIQIDRHDVAVMMALLKIARTKTGGYVRDTYTDSAAYLSLAGQFRKTEATPR